MAPWAFPAAMTLVLIATAGAFAQSPWPSPTQPQAAPAWPSSPASAPSAAPSAPSGPAPQAPSGGAQAPWPSTSTGPATGSGFGAAPAAFPQQQRARLCMEEFLPLRQDVEKKAGIIKAVAPKRNQPETCAAFRSFTAAEAKMIKYVEENATSCGIPADASKTMKSNHAKAVDIRNKVCAPAQAAAPPAPSLSDALGTSRLPDPTAVQTRRGGGGTFDTLTGNPLAR